MADIELVIKIPEEAYQLLKNEGVDWLGAEHILNAVANGTPLPKGHGDLKDTDELLKMTKNYKSELGRLKADPFVKCGIETVESFIREMPTIIEADKEQTNKNDSK